MADRHETTHLGTTEIVFRTSLGTPVEGLCYRLTDGEGNSRSASTGRGGNGLTIQTSTGTHSAPNIWTVPSASRIQIDVQRDDGSWKTIGGFRHDAGKHKQVSVIAGAVAIPFQMDPV